MIKWGHGFGWGIYYLLVEVYHGTLTCKSFSAITWDFFDGSGLGSSTGNEAQSANLNSNLGPITHTDVTNNYQHMLILHELFVKHTIADLDRECK